MFFYFFENEKVHIMCWTLLRFCVIMTLYLIPQNSNRFCHTKEGTNPAVRVTERKA